MKLSEQHKLGVALIGLLIALKMLFVPWLAWVTEQTDEVNQLMFNKAKLEQVERRSQLLLTQKTNIEKNFETLNTLWLDAPVSQVTVEAFQHLDKIAGEFGVELTNRSAAELTSDGPVLLPVSLFASGTPEQIMAFIHALEHRQPLFQLSRVTVTRPNVVAKKVNANLEVHMFVKPGGAS
jgi:hypothetical protein